MRRQLHTLKSGETKDNDSFFRFLRACCESSFIVSCSISDCVAESARSDGLVPHRAYSLAAVTKVGPGTRLVQLRNSWVDEHEWKGPWSKGAQERGPFLKVLEKDHQDAKIKRKSPSKKERRIWALSLSLSLS